jgi:hypothetical protein
MRNCANSQRGSDEKRRQRLSAVFFMTTMARQASIRFANGRYA